MSKILVTGAGGYIGRHVVKRLCDMGEDVTAVGLNMDRVDSRARKIECDIFADPDIYKETGRPDVCLHMAWRDGFIHNSDAHMTDLSKHYLLISNMLKSGLKHLAIMGSMHEVGYWEGAIREDTPCNPISMYGIAKDSLRRSTFLLAEKYGICLQWLRAYYIYGDDKNNHSIFTKICEAEEKGQRRFPFTMGKNKYDFITVEELARQISASITQTEVAGIINCCSGQPISLGEKVERFIKEHAFSIELDYGAFPDRTYDSPGIWGDATKIKTILTSVEN